MPQIRFASCLSRSATLQLRPVWPERFLPETFGSLIAAHLEAHAMMNEKPFPVFYTLAYWTLGKGFANLWKEFHSVTSNVLSTCRNTTLQHTLVPPIQHLANRLPKSLLHLPWRQCC